MEIRNDSDQGSKLGQDEDSPTSREGARVLGSCFRLLGVVESKNERRLQRCWQMVLGYGMRMGLVGRYSYWSS
jgi:hypothetical protein